MYKIHPRYANYKELIRSIGDKVVNLAGTATVAKIPATKKTPAYEIAISAATQDDLALAYAQQEANPVNKKIIIREEKPKVAKTIKK